MNRINHWRSCSATFNGRSSFWRIWAIFRLLSVVGVRTTDEKIQRPLFMSVATNSSISLPVSKKYNKKKKIVKYSFDTVLLEPFTCDEEGRNIEQRRLDFFSCLVFLCVSLVKDHRLNLDEIGGRVSNVDLGPFPVLSIKSCADIIPVFILFVLFTQWRFVTCSHSAAQADDLPIATRDKLTRSDHIDRQVLANSHGHYLTEESLFTCDTLEGWLCKSWRATSAFLLRLFIFEYDVAPPLKLMTSSMRTRIDDLLPNP